MTADKPWLTHYDQGVPASLEYPSVPLFHYLEESARQYPSRACTIFKGAVISYQKMNAITDQVAAALHALGVKKGDRVGIFMPNTPQFVMAYFGILKAGAVVVATNPLYTPKEIEYQVNDAGVEVMFVMSNFYQTIKLAQPRTRIKTLIVSNIKETLSPLLRLIFTLTREKKGGFHIQGGLAPGDHWLPDLLDRYKPADRPQLDISPDDTCLLQYTGGTTGIAKGAIATHRNVVANTSQIRAWFVTAEEGREIVLMAIPLFHVYGMVAGMTFALATAASMVMIPNPRDLPDVLSSIDRYKPTVFPGVPTLYNAINHHPDVAAHKYNLRSIKACISGSAPLPPETKQKFETLTGGVVFEGFGLSEAPTATHCNPLLGVNKTGSIGMPLPDVECRIISLDDEQTGLPPGQVGELVTRAPQVMVGYQNMPEETIHTLRQLPGAGGPWLFTGDIARMDEDGYFYIVDRKKELIKPGGYQVWPREVEDALLTHPKVQEAAVAGIPDSYRGETVKAWIVLQPGQLVSEEELKRHVREQLAPFKAPTHIEFRSSLPKTLVGKVLRRELVRQHKENQPA